MTKEPPKPTALPKTKITKKRILLIVLAAVLVVLVVGGILTYRNDQNIKAYSQYWQILEKANALLDALLTEALLTEALLGEQNYDSVVEECNKAIEIFPKEAAAYHTRALAYQCAGKNTQAINDLEKCLELDPSNNSIKELIAKLKEGSE